MDLEISNLALNNLIKENQILVNGFINKVQTTKEDFLKLKIHTKNGDKTTITNNKVIFISKTSILAKQNPGGFSSFIKKYIFNQRIISLKQHGFDRIVIMEFPSVYLIFELFSKGNIILCDKNYKIIRSMKKEKWKDRELKKDEIYKFPSSKGQNPLEINKTEFFKLVNNNNKTIFGSIVEILNVAPGIINYLFEIKKWDKKINSKDISEDKCFEILKEIQKIYSKNSQGAFILDNVIYSININCEKKYETITDLLNNTIFLKENIIEKKEKLKTSKRTVDYTNQINNLIKDEEEFQKIGETIYLEYSNLNNLINKINQLKKTGLEKENIIKELKKSENKFKKIELEKNKLIIEI